MMRPTVQRGATRRVVVSDKPLQAIFYDFDGVLAESVEVKTRAFYQLFAHKDEALARQLVAYHRAHGGVSRFRKFDYFQETLLGGAPLSDADREELDRAFSQLVVDGVINSDWVPGAREMLERHRGMSYQFVVSGTPETELHRIVEARGMAQYFDEVRGSPATKSVLTAELLQSYGLVPRACLFIGDAMTDYEAAMAHGMGFVGRVPVGDESPFPSGTRTMADLRPLVMAA